MIGAASTRSKVWYHNQNIRMIAVYIAGVSSVAGNAPKGFGECFFTAALPHTPQNSFRSASQNTSSNGDGEKASPELYVALQDIRPDVLGKALHLAKVCPTLESFSPFQCTGGLIPLGLLGSQGVGKGGARR